MAANEGEEDVTNLIDTHCHVLKDPGLAVVRQELPLNVSKVDLHVHFQNAAMTVVSFKENVNNLTTGYELLGLVIVGSCNASYIFRFCFSCEASDNHSYFLLSPKFVPAMVFQ